MPPTTPEPLTRRGIPVDRELRILALSLFANRFGGGAVLTTTAIYFTHQVGFTPGQVALALSVSAIVGLIVQVPAGQLADTRGPRELLSIAVAGAALFAFQPVLATTPLMLAVLLALLAVFEQSARAINQGVIAQLATGGRGVLFKAYLRAVTNSALALGSVFGGAALVIDERWAYVAVFGLNAAFTAFAAWTCTRLPHLPPYRRPRGEPRLAVIRDWPYVVIATLTGIFALHFIVMDLGLALFIAQRTDAPKVMVAILLILNTVMVAAFQVRLSRRADSVPTAARALLVGAGLIALGFVVVGFAGRGPVWLVITLLIVGSLIHVIGEMIGSGGQWGLQMGLAPHEKQGQYQGFAGLGWSIIGIVGPPVVTYLCVTHSRIGWWVLGAVMLGTGLAGLPLSRWALANRERYGVTSHSG